MSCYSCFLRFLDNKNIVYTELKDYAVEILTHTDTIDNIRIVIGFDEYESKRVWMKSWSIGRFDGELYGKAMVLCNSLNLRYRWFRFLIDAEHDVALATDAVVDESSVGDELFELIIRMLSIMDSVYPEYMKIRWG